MRLCRNVQKKLKHSRGFHPRRFVLPQKCDNSWTGNGLSSLQQGRWGGRGTVPSLNLHVFLFHLLIKGILQSRFFNNFQKKYFPGSLFPVKKRAPFRCHWLGKTGPVEKLLCWFACFIFYKDRGDCFGCYWSPHKNGEFPAVVNVCHLETDNQSKAKAGDTY